MQLLDVLGAGVTPSTTEDEPDNLITLNNMLSSWSEQRRRVNNMTVEFLSGITTQITNAAKISITGSPAQSALESTLAAALAGISVTPLTALATYATITTDNTYQTGMDWAIQTNLAVKIAGRYKRAVPPSVAADAELALAYVLPALQKAA